MENINVDYESIVLNTMNPKGYFKTYKVLVKKLEDFCTAGLLCELISKYDFYKDKGQLKEDKWFFYTRDDIQRDFFFSEYQQREMLKKLEKEGLVVTTVFPNTIPQRKYYTLDFKKIVDYISGK